MMVVSNRCQFYQNNTHNSHSSHISFSIENKISIKNKIKLTFMWQKNGIAGNQFRSMKSSAEMLVCFVFMDK